MPLTPGTRLGPYEVLALLGAGGMGEVYRARDTRLNRDVAIKVMPDALAADAQFRERFEREARTISQLDHPHICALFDVGEQQGTFFFVMQYLEGQTLAERLIKGPLPFDQVVKIAIQIATALDTAHRAGVVHRDVKPGNVMLTPGGAKLLDFGLAKTGENVAPGGMSALPTTPPNMTAPGTVLGTFQYMAPEQLEGREADPRSDIFSFGAVLYEMATGQKAFAGTSQASLISRIMSAEPAAVSSLAPNIPAAYDRIVRRCLAKDPERRWQSARDVALELEEVAAGDEVSAPAQAQSTRRGALAGWAVAAALLVALAGLFAARWSRSEVTAMPALRFAVSPPAGSELQGMLALSPDGRRLAFVATGADGRDLLWTRALDALETRSLDGTEGAAYPFWSPDGRALAFFAHGKLKKIELSGGVPQTLCDASSPRGGSWGAAGTIIFSNNAGGEMRRVSASGGQATALPQLTSQSGVVSRWPSFLPDGRQFLYYSLADDPLVAGVRLASLDSAEIVTVANGDSGAVYVAPGILLYRSGDRLMSQPFDARQRRVTGEAVPVVEDVWWDGISTLATAFSASSGGIVAYQTGGLALTRLQWYDRAGKATGVVGPSGAYLEPAISPDGRWLAIGRTDTASRGPVVWMIDLERGSLTRISSSEILAATPLWSPDGRRIVYSGFPSGEVYVREAQSAEKERVLYKASAFTPLDDWSRDGRYLFYERIDWPKFRFAVGIRDLQTGTDRMIPTSAFNELGARLSPDGRWLAYQAAESGTSDVEIFVRSFPEPTFRRQVSVGGGTQPRWRGDSRELFYISTDRKVMSVDVKAGETFEAGAPRALFQTRILPVVEARNHYDVSADGQRFLINSRRSEDASLPITVVIGWSSDRER